MCPWQLQPSCLLAACCDGQAVIMGFGFGETQGQCGAGKGPQQPSALVTLLAGPLGCAAQTCLGAVTPRRVH